MGEEEILARLEEEGLEQRARVKALLLEHGRSDLAADLEGKLREVDLGLTGARSCWTALSPAQRRVMEAMSTGRRLVRSAGSRHRYDATGEPHALSHVAGTPTVRNLAARGLVAWEGGAFDPERRASLTEKGRFVWQHRGEMPDA